MQFGMIGLGRMGANMARRLMRAGHTCVAYDVFPESVEKLAAEGASGAKTLQDFVGQLSSPRVVWMMVPAANVDSTIDQLAPLLQPGDILVDGGNSYYRDDVERAKRLAERGIKYVDCGTSGGVLGLSRGYCLMIGGDADVVRHLDPIFKTLAPGMGDIAATQGAAAESTAQQGYLHCGANGAGHFVKMVHNGIEYGLMAAYAEGFNILRHANIGKRHTGEADAETTPLRNAKYFQYDFDLSEIAEVWRRGSVISSWLLDLTAQAFARDGELGRIAGNVSDSGEGRWTMEAAVEEGVPAHVLSAALFQRFSSRGAADFQNRLLSAMRFEFGGHHEKK
ncbi:MAG: phosphogluconate dehydrogenase (NAD(+)-dependent, decarboxylating) [Myxococcales bacterium]